LFLVAGAKKAEVVRNIFTYRPNPGMPTAADVWPAAGVHPAGGSVTWLLDAAAASGLALPNS
jgi:6-phosphogluconolactonase/glucosamine-6-phosphate isomerase/deaminase